jgi:glutamine amidotransferase
MGYIGIVDYGAGNLMSVSNSLTFLGYESKIITTSREMEDASKIILPGVGAFPDAMEALEQSGLMDSLLKNALKKPFLGICLGMQMLFSESDEIRVCKGLGLLPGRIERIPTPLKLPQIGWNALEIQRRNAMLSGIKDGDYVYFVHSFMAVPQERSDLAAVCDYGAKVPAMVARDQIFGCQFHPEKSGKLGLAILKNYLTFVSRM